MYIYIYLTEGICKMSIIAGLFVSILLVFDCRVRWGWCQQPW